MRRKKEKQEKVESERQRGRNGRQREECERWVGKEEERRRGSE